MVFELHEYVVYQYNSHLRGRLLEYKCELQVQHLHSQISQNMEQWMSYTMILYNMKVEISMLVKKYDTVNQKFAYLNKFIVGLTCLIIQVKYMNY